MFVFYHSQLQGSGKIGDEVIHIFYADGKPQHIRIDSSSHLLLRTELRMRRRCRMHDKRLGITDTPDMKNQLKLAPFTLKVSTPPKPPCRYFFARA